MSLLGSLGKLASVAGNTAFLPLSAALNASGIDTTPGFNIDAHAGGGVPFLSKGNGNKGIAS
jgi:hypothetical protein